jgi:copper(I)-binding protein
LNAAPWNARRIGMAAVAVLALTLTGCAAGQHAQTADVVSAVDGVSANAGPVALRAVTVSPPTDDSFPADGDAPMEMVIVNNGRTDDHLISVSTPAANEVRFLASLPGDATTATSTDTASPSATDLPTIPSINLPMGHATSIGYTPDLPQVQLTGLTKQLFPAQSFPITFQFARAGSVTFTVAVHLTPGPSKTPTVDISPTAEG